MPERILITGQTGFVGTHFAEYIKEDGRYEITHDSPDHIIHLGARTNIDKSIVDPEFCVEENVMFTMMMLELARKLPKLKTFVYFSCYDEETRAMTSEGFKHYSELHVGDSILSFNPKTRELEEKIIEKVIVQDYAGDMVWFKNSKANLLVTPNHKMFYRTPVDRGIQVSDAAQVSKRSNVYLPMGSWRGEEPVTVYVSELGELNASALFYVCGVFIADGFTAYQERKGSRSWRIFFDVPEKDKARKNLESGLSDLGINFHAQKGASGEHIYFTSEKWLKFFLQFGKGAHNKHIPSWMLRFGPCLLQKLFDGLIDGDGYRDGPTIALSTVSERLVKDACELGLKVGRNAVFDEVYNEGEYKGRIIKGHSFQVRFPKEAYSVGKGNASYVPYKGKIWCVVVPDNHNLVVERHGKIAICGNTDEVFGPAPEGARFKEWHRYNSSNPYAASKAAGEELCLAWASTYGVPVIITHCQNLIGERQPIEKFLPTVVRAAVKGSSVKVYADPDTGKPASRDYLHARDAASAVLFLLEKGQFRNKYNISANRAISSLELINQVNDILDVKVAFEMVSAANVRPGFSVRYGLDGSKLLQMGWKPPKTFEENLRSTVAWMVATENKKWLEL